MLASFCFVPVSTAPEVLLTPKELQLQRLSRGCYTLESVQFDLHQEMRWLHECTLPGVHLDRFCLHELVNQLDYFITCHQRPQDKYSLNHLTSVSQFSNSFC